MSNKSPKRFNLWEEFKRRKVFRVIVMYAGAAYVIIELVNNVAEPLRLPEWVPVIVIILLIIGFPVVAVLSWIFDITPQGIQKTVPAEIDQKKLPLVKERRKLRLSDVIIAVLIVVVLLLAYPRVFRSQRSLASMTFPVTVMNEYGEKEKHRVFRKEYITKK